MKKSSLSDEQFLSAYIQNGYNAKQAYLKLHPDVTEDSAKTLGSRYLKRVKSAEIMRNLSSKVYRNLEELLDSKDERIKLAITKNLLDRLCPKALYVEKNIEPQVVQYRWLDSNQS